MLPRYFASLVLVSLFSLLVACAGSPTDDVVSEPFVVAVIPDTQNMLDYTHQAGHPTPDGTPFPINAADQFQAMMQYIADNTVPQGGEIAFASSVGDVWQHQTELVDEEHAARGHAHTPDSPLAMSGKVFATEKTRTIEMPQAVEGYRVLAISGIPFGVAPGNHDYDAMWSDAKIPGDPSRLSEMRGYDPEILGILHIGGLENFRSVFGEGSELFRDQAWYVDAHNGGASSAQLFEAGGYRFLHLALEMQPADDVLTWAQGVIDRHPGLPTILTTHDYLDTHGDREPASLVDLARIDPGNHNTAEQLFRKVIAPNDQIFMVLCGHQHGQAYHRATNAAGNAVHEVLADYQERGQSVLDVAPDLRDQFNRPYPIGDGWLRLMRFELGGASPRVVVKTYSAHYNTYSGDLPTYADWYKAIEDPDATDAAFLEADDYVIELDDFRSRFGVPEQ